MHKNQLTSFSRIAKLLVKKSRYAQFVTGYKKLPNDIQDVTRRKLGMINNAQNIYDLRISLANS